MERISPRFLNTFPPDKMLCHPYWMAEPPFRIWGNLYFVGNSWCSSHLIDTGDGLILLDTPCLAELPYLLDSIWSVGFNPREIRMILISHAHHDHYGAASALRHITGAKICLSAVDAADIVLVDDEIKELPHLISLSKKMITSIKINLTFSMMLNFIAITFAITGLLGPVIGALVHNAGSVLVITNSALLLKWKDNKAY